MQYLRAFFRILDKPLSTESQGFINYQELVYLFLYCKFIIDLRSNIFAGMNHYPICWERSIFFMLMVQYMLFLLMLLQA